MGTYPLLVSHGIEVLKPSAPQVECESSHMFAVKLQPAVKAVHLEIKATWRVWLYAPLAAQSRRAERSYPLPLTECYQGRL